MTRSAARIGSRLGLAMLLGVAALLVSACDGDDPGDEAPTAETEPITTPTATEEGEGLTADESAWIEVASTVGPNFVADALEAIARDRDDESAVFAALDATDGTIETAAPSDAPGRFAGPHAALLAAREAVAAFLSENRSRADSGTEYDALLAAYEQAIIEWAAVVGVEVPTGG